MTVFRDDTGDVAHWLGAMLGQVFVPPFICFGILNTRGGIGGACLFNDFTGPNIELTAYGPGMITRSAVRFAMKYVFVDSGCLRLSATTKRSNKATRKVLSKFGFQYEGTRPRYFGPLRGDDGLMFGLQREAVAKWLEKLP